MHLVEKHIDSYCNCLQILASDGFPYLCQLIGGQNLLLIIILINMFFLCNQIPDSNKTLVAVMFLFSGCKAAAKLLFTGTLTLGCKSYLDAQKNACYCPPAKNKNKKYTAGNAEL